MTNQFENLQVQKRSDNYLVVQLDRGSANPLNVALMQELRQLLADTKDDQSIRGLVLTGKQRFFSGGLDLMEMYYLNPADLRAFWSCFIYLVNELAAYPKPTVASITGYSPAGGCVLACCCDYRVMADNPKYQIGLNEVAVGIAPRGSIFQLYAFWIGQRQAYNNLLLGKLMSPQEAHEIGLVDELCADEEVLERAEKRMQAYLKIGQQTLEATKLALRSDLIQVMYDSAEEMIDRLQEQLWGEESRAIMGQIVAYLKAKKNQKA